MSATRGGCEEFRRVGSTRRGVLRAGGLALTGHTAPKQKSDADGPSANDWPHLGAVVGRCRPSGGAVPS
ncbi:MAG: hypothetical protein LC745_02845, partial [Planctomycetia bacterium]|nr:hypothetical protein [Planctomycetia bacterium]